MMTLSPNTCGAAVPVSPIDGSPFFTDQAT